ncbi:phosphotransferase KptA/Tpt1 [Tolypothrix tenuis PCC 7101]|uniref:Probable RNA 2'-phosphotransferase n=1 Tax=Tolypothrix tenuis PCC 7101 TaxID=231146 RepID=A0A1Z4N0Z7_9CYAN|nr:RNA 2'-phosphotransferase [Aulosira sp. FACHB-113]BAY99370.1 phosphotransferase KptA/Tpt1 [Tolypothrix tenuis PCC 7101]BAZ76709.1 phosphotransferase KptA/Tpt1 [Aulosira laxa NIES-50]
MNDSRLLKISKFLSKHLRHKPADIGIKLASGGWVEINQLLTACAKNKFPITRQELQLVVESNDKQRFSFDSTGTLIRANQGHSVEVDLQLEPVVPPDVLYHGTAKQSVESILQTGLSKMSRHHVHLSKDIATAKNVGARHGKPIVFAVNAAAMHQAGYIFYCSDNGVWLVDNVPPEYLQII